MNRKNVFVVLIDLIFLIVFNAVFFIVTTERNTTTWISYGFIHLSYMMLLLLSVISRKGTKSTVIGYSTYTIATLYFLIEFVLGLFFIFRNQETVKLALVLNIILFGIYALLLLSSLLADEHMRDGVLRREEEVLFIKTASSRLNNVMMIADDKSLKRKIEQTCDLLRTSPSKSTSQVKETELQIENKISELEAAIQSKQIVSCYTILMQLDSLIRKRNLDLKNSN